MHNWIAGLTGGNVRSDPRSRPSGQLRDGDRGGGRLGRFQSKAYTALAGDGRGAADRGYATIAETRAAPQSLPAKAYTALAGAEDVARSDAMAQCRKATKRACS